MLGTRPMSVKIELIISCQCRGDLSRPQRVFFRSQNTPLRESGSPKGGLMIVTLLPGSLALQTAFLQSPCLMTRLLSVAMEARRRREEQQQQAHTRRRRAADEEEEGGGGG